MTPRSLRFLGDRGAGLTAFLRGGPDYVYHQSGFESIATWLLATSVTLAPMRFRDETLQLWLHGRSCVGYDVPSSASTSTQCHPPLIEQVVAWRLGCE